MKRLLICFLIAIIIFLVFTLANSTDIRVLIDKFEIEEYVVLSVPNPDYLEGYIDGIQYNDIHKYPFVITIENDGVVQKYTIESSEDIPQNNVSADCIDNKEFIITKCWFIKYTDIKR